MLRNILFFLLTMLLLPISAQAQSNYKAVLVPNDDGVWTVLAEKDGKKIAVTTITVASEASIEFFSESKTDVRWKIVRTTNFERPEFNSDGIRKILSSVQEYLDAMMEYVLRNMDSRDMICSLDKDLHTLSCSTVPLK